jgi:hypothetical protein
MILYNAYIHFFSFFFVGALVQIVDVITELTS